MPENTLITRIIGLFHLTCTIFQKIAIYYQFQAKSHVDHHCISPAIYWRPFACQNHTDQFIENPWLSLYKTSNYAWEKKQISDSSAQSTTAADIARSLSMKSKKKEEHQSPILSHSQKFPVLPSCLYHN